MANIFVLEIDGIKPYNVGLAGNQAFHESPNYEPSFIKCT